MESFDPAPYMRWAKYRPHARYDLAGSNLVACTRDDAPGIMDDLPLTGPGPEGYPPLFEAIGKRYGVGSERIALATGCSEANFLVCAALLRPGDETLVEAPVYDPLETAARMVGARVVRFERRFGEKWAVDPDRVARAMTRHTRLVIMSSPHNPSGVVASQHIVRTLGDIAEKNDAWILVDEVYRDAVYGRHRESAAHAHPRCIATNSLTKSYGLPGLRCGWAIGSPEVIERIRRARDAVDAVGVYPAEVASTRAFAMIDRLEARARAILEPNLERVAKFIESRSELEWVRPDGGTVAFPRFVDGRDSEVFAERLLRDHETAIVPGRFFGAPEHLRVAFGMASDMLEAGLGAISQLVHR